MRTRGFVVAVLVFMLAPGLALAGGDAAAGKKVYTQYCVSCHGATGQGNGPAAAALNPKPRDLTDKSIMTSLTDEHLFKVIQGGGASVGKSPLMPPWGAALDKQNIENVIAFIRSLTK